MDVPLHVIEGDQFAPADVSPVAVTDQLHAHLAAIVAPLPAEVAAFSQVAARLLVLKSRSVLPRPRVAMADDSGASLIRQFREHQALSATLADLADRGQRGGRLFS